MAESRGELKLSPRERLHNMKSNRISPIARVIGGIPYRLALAGGWIDQPFVSRRNPRPPGSMVVVGLEPAFRFMDRSGIATGTREVATRVWHGQAADAPAG